MTFSNGVRKMAARFAASTGAMLLLASIGSAATVTYDFTQSGWFDPDNRVSGVLSVTVSGTPESNGTLQLGDLTSFNATYREVVGGIPQNFIFTGPNLFSFNPAVAGSLDFAVTQDANAGLELCSGLDTITPASAGGCGASAAISGFFKDEPLYVASTTQTATLTPTATAPEPGTGFTVAGVGALLLLVGSRRRRLAKRVTAARASA